MFSIGLVEAIWIGACLIGAGFTVFAVFDANANMQAFKRLSNGTFHGSAREIAVRADMRRELLRLLIQVIAFLLAIPGVFSDTEIPLNPFVLGLMAIPLILLLQSILDRKARHDLSDKTADELLTERERSDLRVQQTLESLDQDIKVEAGRNDALGIRLDEHMAESTRE